MSAPSKKFNPDTSTGLGERTCSDAGRLFHKNGRVNVTRRGVRFLNRFSWFHTLVSLPRWKFWSFLFLSYLLVNLVFGTVYYLIGIEFLGGIHTGSEFQNFAEAFFFSAQTFTTVGYGRISPTGFSANAIAALEAFLGMLSFALTSGLFYGRFSVPKPFLYFSEKALIAPNDSGRSLTFRLVPYKNNHLSDAEIRLTLVMRTKQANGDAKNEFFTLPVVISKVQVLVLDWTIAHPINEESPLYHYSLQELEDMGTELLVSFKAYDEVFANAVTARTSYMVNEFIEGARFLPMHDAAPGRHAMVDIRKLNEYELTS